MSNNRGEFIHEFDNFGDLLDYVKNGEGVLYKEGHKKTPAAKQEPTKTLPKEAANNKGT